MGVEATIKEIASELEKIANTKTVVGEPITAAGKTIIPISRSNFTRQGYICKGYFSQFGNHLLKINCRITRKSNLSRYN